MSGPEVIRPAPIAGRAACSGRRSGGGGGPPTAKCITSALAVGTHVIVGTYSGDGANASSSGNRSQVVNPSPPVATTTVLISSLRLAVVGQSITFTASVTGNALTGPVGFTANAAPIGGCTAVALAGAGNTRTAQCTTSFASRGNYLIVGQYSGDAGNNPSNGGLSQRVK